MNKVDELFLFSSPCKKVQSEKKRWLKADARDRVRLQHLHEAACHFACAIKALGLDIAETPKKAKKQRVARTKPRLLAGGSSSSSASSASSDENENEDESDSDSDWVEAVTSFGSAGPPDLELALTQAVLDDFNGLQNFHVVGGGAGATSPLQSLQSLQPSGGLCSDDDGVIDGDGDRDETASVFGGE